MTLAKAERPVFAFNKGFNSDAPSVTFPADFSVNESNFELLIDGTRRRRRGLEGESENVLDTTQPIESSVRTFKWRAVGEDPDINFHVVQVGNKLYFMDDVEDPSAHVRNFTFDLTSIAVAGHEDDEQGLVDMAFGRGQALLVGQYLEPAYLTYNPTSDTVSSFPIQIRERDFKDQPDSTDNVTSPKTLSDAYQYNLFNRGWTPENIHQYFSSTGSYPAKNMLMWLGYRRKMIEGYTDVDGTREFSSLKLLGELFQDAPAPLGHLIKNPFATNLPVDISDEFQGSGFYTVPYSSADPATNMSGWTPKDPTDLNLPKYGNPKINQVTAELGQLHGLEAGDSITVGCTVPGVIGCTFPVGGVRSWDFNGTYTVDSVTDTSITFTFTLVDDAQGWDTNWAPRAGNPNWPYVTISGSPQIQLTGSVVDERPTVTAFYAGRAVFGGVPNPELGSALFISQVIEKEDQYGKCYQVADPTSQELSDLVPTDGLVLRIPEFGRLYHLRPYGNSLLAFASGGVWQIGPGSSGYFTATSYSIRKLSDVQCVNATSVVDAEGTPVFGTTSGIFNIQQDPQAGFLFTQSMSLGVIDTWYAGLGKTARATLSADFDGVNKRVVWIYQLAGDSKALVLDLKFKSFTLWDFEVPVNDVFTVTELGSTSSTLRYLAFTDDGFVVSRATSLTFADFGVDTTAYMLTGFDTGQAPTRRKQAPVITVFANRTELATASTEGEDAFISNEGSLFLQARWDWSNNAVSGKWAGLNQVYRHRRQYVFDSPETGPLPDGYPIVVTRNKLRGRGRALQLYFEAEAGKDAHVLGWSINFDVFTSN